MSMLLKLFQAYGFSTPEDQQGVLRLLALSGAFDPEKLSEDLKAVGYSEVEISHSLEIAQQVKGDFLNQDLIFKQLFPEEVSVWPHKLHDWFIRVTQRDFFARKAGQERWQIETGSWMEKNADEIKRIGGQLRLDAEVTHQLPSYDAVAVFGATAPEMKKRLLYLKELIDAGTITTTHLYLLSGERYADEKADGGEEYLDAVAKRYNVKREKITEAHLMQAAYDESSDGPIFSKLPMTLINAPKGIKHRPTTIDTLVELAKQAPQLRGHVLFISSAPNILSQAEDTMLILGELLPQLTPEIIGDAAEDLPVNRSLMAFAAALFGGYPRVAQLMGCTEPKKVIENKRNALGFMTQSTAFFVSSVGDTDLALGTVAKLMESRSINPIILIPMTSVAEARVKGFVERFPQVMQRSLREITDTNPEKIMSVEDLEKIQRFVQAHNIRQAYVGVPSPLDEEGPFQIARALRVPITLVYEYMFTAPKEHAFWKYLSQLPASCHVVVPTDEAAKDVVKYGFKTHLVGHLSIDRGLASQAVVDVKGIQEKLMVSENQDLAFISGTTQPTIVDCQFLDALLSALNTGDYKNIQVRFGIHPGVKDMDAYVVALLKTCEKYPDLKDQFKIILPSSIESKLLTVVQSDFTLRANVSGSEASQIANRVAQAVPGALINESALQGKPVYFHDQTVKPYLPSALFSKNISGFFAEKPRPRSIPEELNLSVEGSAPMRMAQVLERRVV